MHLHEFFDYKNQLMGDIISNEKIVALLNDFDDYKPAKPEDLAYTQLYPYQYIPETIEHGQSIICFDVDIQKATTKTFYYPILYIWVFTHKDKLRLPEGGVRTDAICAELAEMLDGSRYYGLGELKLFAAKRFAPLNDYQGKVLTFDAVDFSKTHSPGKSIPANRKN